MEKKKGVYVKPIMKEILAGIRNEILSLSVVAGAGGEKQWDE